MTERLSPASLSNHANLTFVGKAGPIQVVQDSWPYPKPLDLTGQTV
jgi:hypothetical protein